MSTLSVEKLIQLLKQKLITDSEQHKIIIIGSEEDLWEAFENGTISLSKDVEWIHNTENNDSIIVTNSEGE